MNYVPQETGSANKELGKYNFSFPKWTLLNVQGLSRFYQTK
jgi:hypothetical protein